MATNPPEADGGVAEERPAVEEPVEASSDAFKRLQRRVETAARELERLRRENHALTKRVQELEKRPDVPNGGTLLTLEDRPDVVRQRVQQLIDVIDMHLEGS